MWGTFLDLLCDWYPVIACYACVAVVGLFVAVVELLSRYGAGNRPRWVLLGAPQSLYYVLNAVAAGVGLFASEVLEKTQVVSLFSTKPSLALLQAGLVGFGAMFALRSSLFAIDGRSGRAKVDVGPAQVLNVLNQYLDRQIDKQRGKAALEEVALLMEGVIAEQIYPDVLICLAASESIPPAEGERLKKDLDLLMSSSDWKNPEAKAISMGLKIQKELGTDTLGVVVELLQSLVAKRAATPPKNSESKDEVGESQGLAHTGSNDVKSLDKELSAVLDKLRPSEKGASK